MAFHYSPKIVTDGLVFCIDAANPKSFIDGNTTWNDLSRSGNNGTLINGPTFDSANGGSIVFDGLNDYVDFDDSDLFSFGNGITDNPFSVCCWVYCVDSTRFRTLSKGTEWLHGPFGNDSLGLILLDNNSSNYIARTTTTIIPQNVWVSLISTYDGSGLNTGIKHYINGVESIGYNNLSAGSYTAMHNKPTNFYVGRDIDYGNHYANGKISNTKVYNKVLTNNEIQQNYNATKGRFGL